MRLFFHIQERGRFEEDEEGADFSTVEDAHREAIVSAREMMAERIITGRRIDGISFVISDEHRTSCGINPVVPYAGELHAHNACARL